MKFLGILFLVLFVLTSSCNKPPRPPKKGPRYIPVEVTTVRPHTLTHKAHLTGTMLPWKMEAVRFQVAGNLAKLVVRNPGVMVRGELKDENGTLLHRGDIIAELDKEPFLLAKEEAENQLMASKTKLEAAKRSLIVSEETIKAAQTRIDAAITDIQKIYPLNLKIVAAQRKLAEQEYELIAKAYQKQDTTNSRVLQMRTQMLIAKAEEQKLILSKSFKKKEIETYRGDLSKAMVEKDLRKAQIKISEAEVLLAASGVKRTNKALDQCDLRAPFDGMIASVDVNPGVLTTPGTVIFTLAMMDPMRIDVSVSFKRLRDFHVGEEVAIYPMGNTVAFNKPEKGILYYLNTSADPSTRTFLAVFAARNFRKSENKNISSSKYPHYSEFSSLVYKDPQGAGNLFVDTRCILRDKKGAYVWRIQGKKIVASVEKVYITLGKEVSNVITWIFREVVNSADLKENEILLVGKEKDFKKLKHGSKIVRRKTNWVFRPRQLVTIEYERELPKGIYLPSDAIIQSQGEVSDSFYVFVLESIETKNGKITAQAVRRNIIKTKIEDLWKIEDGLKEGEKVIIFGGYRVNNKYRPLNANIPVIIEKEIDINHLIEGYSLKGSAR